jgi:hypothetical protein
VVAGFSTNARHSRRHRAEVIVMEWGGRLG